MKKFVIVILLTIININTIFPISALAFEEKENNQVKNEILEKIKKGEKIPTSETISNQNYSKDRYVVFIQKDKFDKTQKNVMELGGVITNTDDNSYGNVKALPIDIGYMTNQKRDEFINKLDLNKSVVAITPVQKRYLNAIPTIDDPLYPTDLSYDSTKQWYLSQPSGSFKGIDVYRAWQHIDGLTKNFSGESTVLVAVIDTGAAYENYSKYDEYSKMVTPSPWVFSKGSDFTDNLYVDSGETANNQINDDNNDLGGFCIDKNSNGACNAGEPSGIIDDRNGFNVVDWGLYWSRVTYDELIASSVCNNEPYLSSGVKCVTNPSNDSVCELNGLTNFEYLGCYESDMGHPNDSYGHGTVVSNVISAKIANGISGVGIAGGVSILPIKVFGEYYDSQRTSWVYDSAYADQIVAALNYAKDAGADIINMSFAGDTIDYYEKLVMDQIFEDDDILLVAASGNSSNSVTNYPAGYSSVMSVGASTKTGTRASYSSYGGTLDVSAPVDTGILTQGMWNTNTNQAITKNCSWNSTLKCINGDPTSAPSIFSGVSNLSVAGTSLAAPQVSAVAALLLTTYPNLKASDLKYILEMSSFPNGSAQHSTSIGHGVLNAYNAVRAVDYRDIPLDTRKRVFQSMVSSSGYTQTRYSDTFGARWSGWITGGSVKSVGSVSSIKIPTQPERIIQIMKGTNSGVYVRRADDWGYISNDDSQWSNWALLGYSSGGISRIVAGNNIVVSWKGNDGKIYTRYTTDGITWGSANISAKTILSGISMVFDSTNNVIVQGIVSSGNYTYLRRSTDYGVTWGSWVQSLDYAISEPSFIFVDGRINRAVRSSDGVVLTRYSEDGGSTWSSRNRTYGTSGMSKSSVVFNEISISNKLLQTYRGYDNSIYTRISTDNGSTWSNQTVGVQFLSGVRSTSTPVTVVSDSIINQMVRGTDGYLYFRRSSNEGTTWGGWRNSGSILISGNISLVYESKLDRILVSTRGTNGNIYSRYSDNKGSTWSSWTQTSPSLGSISTTITTTSTVDLSN